MQKLLLLSRTLTNDPKSFGNSGAKKVAFEIAGLLMDIYILVSQHPYPHSCQFLFVNLSFKFIF